jgi:hypothetical protein
LPTEYSQVGSIEVGSGPFAFDGDWLVPSASQDDVNFVATFVAPIRDLTALLAAHDLVQHEVLPKYTKILPSKILPAALVGHKTSIKSVDLGADTISVGR